MPDPLPVIPVLPQTFLGYDQVPLQSRLLEPIGNIPPAEAEERYYAMLDEQPMAA